MTVTFYAQPYNISATGFYFSDAETYRENIDKVVNDYGDRVEEFEIQFINGFVLDSKLARAITPTQGNIIAMLHAMNTWTEDQKLRVIVAVYEGGADFDFETNNPDDIEIDLYHDMTLKELAYQFVDEGMLGEVASNISPYIDYDKLAHDLGHDYAEVRIAGENYVYRMG